ncbi:MAG: ABC-2 family transporter protein [Acetobacteraceae bacterium]|nr:ABC-2 family transporter protein [Acetobacteraceae bacterium]
MSLLGQYRVNLTNAIAQGASYRANFVLGLFNVFVPLGISLLLWSAVFSERDVVGGYSLPAMLSYYLAARWLSSLVRWETDWAMWSHIRDGGLSPYLLRPMNYLAHRALELLGQRLPATVVTTAAVAGFAVLIKDRVALPADAWTWAAFLLSAMLAWTLSTLLAFMRAVGAFWFSETGWISYLDRVLLTLLAGQIVPLDLLPGPLRTVAHWLPFRGMTHLPAQIFLGRAQNVGAELAVQAAWAVAAAACLRALWRKGLRLYQAAGA